MSGSPDASQFICLPVWLVVSGSLDVYIHLSLISTHLSPSLASVVFLHLPPSLAGGVRLFGCLSSLVSQILVVSHAVWLAVPGSYRMFVFTCLHFISLTVWLVVSGSLEVCLHLSPNSSVCESGWRRPALWTFALTCLKYQICHTV